MKKEKVTVWSVYSHGKLIMRTECEAAARTYAKYHSYVTKVTKGFKLV